MLAISITCGDGKRARCIFAPLGAFQAQRESFRARRRFRTPGVAVDRQERYSGSTLVNSARYLDMHQSEATCSCYVPPRFRPNPPSNW
jgi:hypothetical protein